MNMNAGGQNMRGDAQRLMMQLATTRAALLERVWRIKHRTEPQFAIIFEEKRRFSSKMLILLENTLPDSLRETVRAKAAAMFKTWHSWFLKYEAEKAAQKTEVAA
jgi:hypothetical protein